MVEKQFTYEQETLAKVNVFDSDGEFICCTLSIWADQLVDKLNALHEENEQLKQAYTQLKHRHSLLHDVCIEAECDRDSYQKDVSSLEKENEQLKKENEHLKKELGNVAEFKPKLAGWDFL